MTILHKDSMLRAMKMSLAAAVSLLWLLAGAATAFAYTPPERAKDDVRLTSLSKAIAKEPTRFLVEGASGSEVSGSIEIRHTRDLMPVLAPSFYVPKNVVIASVPFNTVDREYSFSYAFWDAGTYSVMIKPADRKQSTKILQVKVVPEPEVLRSTVLLYTSLMFIGLLAGVVGGVAAGKRDGRKKRGQSSGGGAAALTIMVVSVLLAPLATHAYAHGTEHSAAGSASHPGHSGVAAAQTHITVDNESIDPREPVTIKVSGDPGADATFTLRHLEDKIPLFEGDLSAASGDAAVGWVFPEGSQYQVSWGGTERTLSVRGLAPGSREQAISFAVLFSSFIIPMLVGFLACKGIWSSIERRKNG